jgi:endonuclease/exonuclease/phosphatase (EEP) superfamily protein YafD
MKTTLLRIFHYALWFYYILLFTWIAAYAVLGDRFAYLGIVNLIAVYLFFLLPFGLLAAITSRNLTLWLPFGAALLAFLLLWGDLFFPIPRPRSDPGPQLKLMTYNVLAWHSQTAAIIDAIRSESPDIVFIQELNVVLARQLQSKLLLNTPTIFLTG